MTATAQSSEWRVLLAELHKLNRAAARAWKQLRQAEADRLAAERETAAAALAAYRAGDRGPAEWLVWWWNGCDSSPRGDRPAVRDASQIPGDARPRTE